MNEPSAPSRSYEESCAELQHLQILDPGAIPPLPTRRPNYDDEGPLGVRFFRTSLAGADLGNMTLPRTFFGRSEVCGVSFKNTDLSESTFCWNDFVAVDFTDSKLSSSDLRAAVFNGVDFTRADLRNADLRRSRFDDCDFTDADLRGAKLAESQRGGLELSEQQEVQVAWQEDEGGEPGGG